MCCFLPFGFTFFFNKFIYFIYFYFWLCCVLAAARGLSPAMASGGLLPVVVHTPLTAAASATVEHRLQAHGPQQLWHMGSVVVARRLQSTGSVVVVHGLSCSVACGILLHQDSNPHPLLWQADSQPLHHQGSPWIYFFNLFFFQLLDFLFHKLNGYICCRFLFGLVIYPFQFLRHSLHMLDINLGLFHLGYKIFFSKLTLFC